MTSPNHHHYIPQFYLEPWTIKGELIVSKRAYRDFSHRRSSPEGTGYVPRLYAIEGLEDEAATFFETEFLAPLDSDAASARDSLLAQVDMPYRLKLAWTKFILSLLLRNPEELALYKTHIRTLHANHRRELEKHFLSQRAPGDVETYDEYLKRLTPAGIDRQIMEALRVTMSIPALEKRIFEMAWCTWDVSASRYPLLMSDRPLWIPHKLGRLAAYITLPLSPTCLFLAGRSHEVLDQLMIGGTEALARRVNEQTVGQAVKFVYSANRAQKGFIEKWMSKTPGLSPVAGMIEHYQMTYQPDRNEAKS